MQIAAALDLRDEWEAFSRPLAATANRERWESFLAIQGMYCPACSLAVEEALMRTPGVESVEVNGSAAIARVVWTPASGAPSQWIESLRRAGYGAAPAGDQLDQAARTTEQRRLLWRWLVAGFCMMQVMMYAAPAYLAEPGEMTPDMAALLQWASLFLTLPVMLFSCRPFFSSALRDLRARTIGMDVAVALGIAIAFFASAASTFDPRGPLQGEVWYDSLTMFVFFLLSGRLVQQRLLDRTADALRGLARELPQATLRECADGSLETVAVRRLRAGDRIHVKPGEVIPADGRILSGESRVAEAMLTGESRPLRRAGNDTVCAGSHNLTGLLVIEVEKAGRDTRVAEIVALMARAAAEKPPMAQLADRAARPFLLAVVLAAFAAAWWWWPEGPGKAIGVAVAVLIVTCPCALSLATPAATLAAAGALARRGVLVRRLAALEAGASVDTVVFDKTGTLTEDRMAVTSASVREGVTEAQALAWAGALAAQSLHPVSRAIHARAGATAQALAVREVPGSGLEGEVDGLRLRLGSASFCGVNALAGGSVAHLSGPQGWIATFFLDEALRPGASSAAHALQRMGVRVQLLSGDEPPAVQRLAVRAGVGQWFAAQSPEDKLAAVRRLQAGGSRVAMVGDGLNDGPVLARADVSMAMGQGVPIAQAQADFIVMANDPDRVPMVLRQSRRTHRIVRQNLLWAAAYNALCVPLAVVGLMPPWLAGMGMAASSIFVVLNASRLAVIPEGD